jgi:hypothetical protein
MTPAIIDGYGPVINPDDACPFGGGHKWVFYRIFYSPVTAQWYQDLIREKCGFISRGWSLAKLEY